jgi:hypothetical protein
MDKKFICVGHSPPKDQLLRHPLVPLSLQLLLRLGIWFAVSQPTRFLEPMCVGEQHTRETGWKYRSNSPLRFLGDEVIG